jgi:hypothetical protein
MWSALPGLVTRLCAIAPANSKNANDYVDVADGQSLGLPRDDLTILMLNLTTVWLSHDFAVRRRIGR